MSINSRFARKRLLKRDGWLCHYCDCIMTNIMGIEPGELLRETDATIEHIVPRSLFGPSEDWNLVLVCHYCNMARGNEEEWCICGFCATAWSRFKENYVTYRRAVKKARAFVHSSIVQAEAGYRWSMTLERWVRDI